MANLTHEEQMAEARGFMQSVHTRQARDRPRGSRGNAGQRARGGSHPAAQGSGRTNTQGGGVTGAQGGGRRGTQGGGRRGTQGGGRASAPGAPHGGGPRSGAPAKNFPADPSVSHGTTESESTGQEAPAVAGLPPALQQQIAAIAAISAATLKARKAARAAPTPMEAQDGAPALAKVEGDVGLPAPVVEYYQPAGDGAAVDGSSDLIDLHEGACTCKERRQAKGLACSRFAVPGVAPGRNEGRFTGICLVHDTYEEI